MVNKIAHKPKYIANYPCVPYVIGCAMTILMIDHTKSESLNITGVPFGVL